MKIFKQSLKKRNDGCSFFLSSSFQLEDKWRKYFCISFMKFRFLVETDMDLLGWISTLRSSSRKVDRSQILNYDKQAQYLNHPLSHHMPFTII